MEIGDIVTLNPVEVILTFDDSEFDVDGVQVIKDHERFTLEPPNGGANKFTLTYREESNERYTDALKVYRKGYNEKRIFLSYEYSSHNMDVDRLLYAKYVQFNFPDEIAFDTPARFIVYNRSDVKRWMSGIPVEMWDGEKGVPQYPYVGTTIVFAMQDLMERILIQSIPGAPVNLLVTNEDDTQVTVGWNITEIGVPILAHNIYVDGVWSAQIEGNATSRIITGLTNDQEYSIHVTSVNSTGESVPSNSVLATPTIPI